MLKIKHILTFFHFIQGAVGKARGYTYGTNLPERTGDLRETSNFRAGKPGALLKSVYFFSREKIAFFTIFYRFEDFEDFWREKSLYVTAFAPK